MTFILKKTDAEKARLLLQDWNDRFSKKNKGILPVIKNAESIAKQMIETLKSEKHGHIWVAVHEESKESCGVLIADDHKDGFIIRFLISNLLNKEAKGSGRFLVEELIKLADKRNLSIRTTSQSADKFWKKCPGFQLDQSNPTDYRYQPSSSASLNFFQPESQKGKKNGSGSSSKNRP
ncbi:GNAT family N-acetyltransferase [Legionella impletisoli]|uniref:N-acetyltransferase domain-containing protein n=1 Tax=Legionella impletisoli TaxID=343510 RepID=A0A917NCC8_9GAMM|nr:GNAT family N-acetyltransferase [Legionella impletisoli]GGI88034.1 hypothetical protein GCM10007966_15990 [Legionella impletisoli]